MAAQEITVRQNGDPKIIFLVIAKPALVTDIAEILLKGQFARTDFLERDDIGTLPFQPIAEPGPIELTIPGIHICDFYDFLLTPHLTGRSMPTTTGERQSTSLYIIRSPKRLSFSRVAFPVAHMSKRIDSLTKSEASSDAQRNRMHRISVVALLCFALATTAKAENTPLHVAAYKGHVAAIRILVADGANVNARNDKQWTPLHAAAAGGRPAAIDALVNRGANVNAEDRDGWTPLHEAAYEGHSATIEKLLLRGANVDAANEDIGTPLHAAAVEGRVAALKALLAGGASVDARDRHGNAALHHAAYTFQTAAIEALLAGGANVNAKTDGGLTPIGAAQLGIEQSKVNVVPIAAFHEAVEVLKAHGGH